MPKGIGVQLPSRPLINTTEVNVNLSDLISAKTKEEIASLVNQSETTVEILQEYLENIQDQIDTLQSVYYDLEEVINSLETSVYDLGKLC